MSNPDTVDSTQVKLIRSVVIGFAARDADLVLNQLHTDFRFVTYPQSVGTPEFTKEEWAPQLKELISFWPEDPVSTIHSLIETPGKVVVHLTTKAKGLLGLEMDREMMLISESAPDEDGSLKIKRLETFVDSKPYLEFLQTVTEMKANQLQSASHVA